MAYQAYVLLGKGTCEVLQSASKLSVDYLGLNKIGKS